MDDQALLEGIVVFSDEDGPEKHQECYTAGLCVQTVRLTPVSLILFSATCRLPLFLSLRWSVSRTVLMERLLMTLPGVT